MVSIQRLSSGQPETAPVALVLPGAGYTAQGPVLYWPILALADAGWEVWAIDWHSDIDEAARQNMHGFVESALARAEQSLPAPPTAVIGKSLGTFALAHFAAQDVRAAWLTPILTDPVIADAVSALSAGAHLCVGGTADPSWRPDLIGHTRARLITVEDANHSLEITSADWRSSAAAQLELIDQVVQHLLG